MLSLVSFVLLDELDTEAGALFLPLLFLVEVLGAAPKLSELGELGGDSLIGCVDCGEGVANCDLLIRLL